MHGDLPRRERRAFLILLAGVATSCSTFGGTDAGPTTGTFHIDITGGTASTVPTSFDAQSLFAYTYQRAPTDWMCGQGSYTEFVAVNGVVRVYVRVPENPVVNGAHQITSNMCGVYFSVSRYPGLPYSERWDPSSGTLTFSNVNGPNFDFTVTDALMTAGPGAAGNFTANVTANVVNALAR